MRTEIQKQAINDLHKAVCQCDNTDNLKEILWQTIIAFEHTPFFTCSGLPFSYSVKINRKGAYSGEMCIDRKQNSKTVTKASVLQAYRKVYEQTEITATGFIPPFFKGPKAIGQIFGISYLYSLFYAFGLIDIPNKYKAILLGDEGQGTMSKVCLQLKNRKGKLL